MNNKTKKNDKKFIPNFFKSIPHLEQELGKNRNSMLLVAIIKILHNFLTGEISLIRQFFRLVHSCIIHTRP